MYTAFAAREGVGGQGSTRLHMDVADAVNLMLYASERSDGSPGCAVWDLYAQGDADKLRAYLRAKFDLTHSFTDPIHSQHFYLDSEMRRELWDEYGVSSFRVYQYPVSRPRGRRGKADGHDRDRRSSFPRDVHIRCVTWQTASRWRSILSVRVCRPHGGKRRRADGRRQRCTVSAAHTRLPGGKLCQGMERRRAAAVQRAMVRRLLSTPLTER